MSRELAKLIVSENGEVVPKALSRAIDLLEENLYSLGPGRYHDAARKRHLLKILLLFRQDRRTQAALKRIGKPLSHPIAERLIRETLSLPDSVRMTDGHARQAAFAALLTYLRQNVGSCFATAPAILIQQEQPLQFLSDIAQLMGTGRLTRIHGGVDYTVPLSPSWGMGELLKPIILSLLREDPWNRLALSPGLQAAFEKIGLIDAKGSSSERKEQCLALLQKSTYYKVASEDRFDIFNCNQLFRSILLNLFGITEEDLEQYKLRTIQGPLADLVIQAPMIQGGKSLACSRFFKAFEEVKGAFKAMTDNALLKAWEFTLASLSESKADFAKWNLYASLGVNPEDRHGIGESLYAAIQEKITKFNQEIELFQTNYEYLFAQARYLEGRANSASSERDVEWIRAEYQIRRQEINRLLSERDEIYYKGRKLQGLYPRLIAFYGEKIRDYFQEVYDAEMYEFSVNPYDDSPAGFRLMYKFGRSQTAVWTMIYSPTEYIQHLTSFFISTENELLQLPECEGIQKEVAELITIAITTIKREEFLESSIIRLAQAYREPLPADPLLHLHQVKRKPWAYISGGTMSTLVKYYWGAVNEPQEAKRWVERESEYLAYLLDTLKELPLTLQHQFQERGDKGILASSPTHAFVVKPGWPLLRQGWESDLYSYTWVKEHWQLPQQRFLEGILLDSRMMDAIIQQLLLFIPPGYRPLVNSAFKNFPLSMTPVEFRDHVMMTLSYEKWLSERGRMQWALEELDSILYHSLPLFPEHQLRERLTLLFDAVDEIDPTQRFQLSRLIETAEEAVGKYHILSAKDLREIALSLIGTSLNRVQSKIPYYQKLTEKMQQLGLCYPAPFLFADTNWVNNVFGFTLNPGTAALELWRFDDCGSTGHPITLWKRYLNGTEKLEWSLYTKPAQYES